MVCDGTYPRWQNSIKIGSKKDAAKIEYKYVINDMINGFIWEKGVNRSVDLSDYFDKGQDVVVEDLFFNAAGCPPKVYPLDMESSEKKEESKNDKKEESKKL